MPRPHKMFQYVQTTRRQIADELFECDDFVELALKMFSQCPTLLQSFPVFRGVF